MRKPDSLRAAIVALLPEFDRDPARLKMWADKGRIRAPMTPDRGFAWEYTLNLVATDFTGHPSLIFLAINDWLRVNQPDLLAANAPGYMFEADLLDDKSIDIAVELELTEQVVLSPREGGGSNLKHIEEPDPLFANDIPLTNPAANLAEIWTGGEQLVP